MEPSLLAKVAAKWEFVAQPNTSSLPLRLIIEERLAKKKNDWPKIRVIGPRKRKRLYHAAVKFFVIPTGRTPKERRNLRQIRETNWNKIDDLSRRGQIH